MSGFDEFLAAVDRDGAIAETCARALATRRRFLSMTVAGVAVALGRAPGAGAALPKGDVDILNYALVLEYLQASFYTEAERAAAIGIHSVEARHAAWMRELFGITPAVSAFDQPASRRKITEIVASTRFIVAQPATQGRRNPRYTG